MAIDSYTSLQTAVANWLNRSDLTDRIPEFIALAEARARRELKDWLRFTVTATNVTADYVLPATVSEVLSLNYNDGASGSHNFSLELISKDAYQTLMEENPATSSLPGQTAYVDSDIDAGTQTLRFWPPIGSASPIVNLKIEATKVLPALSGSQTTNALLRDAPDVYLYGSLAESAPYLLHDERIPVWEAHLKDAFRGLHIQTERRLYGGAPRSQQFARVFG